MPYDPAFVALADQIGAYHEAHGGWGVLRTVMAGALGDAGVEVCIALAKARNGDEGEAPARALLALPMEQRQFLVEA